MEARHMSRTLNFIDFLILKARNLHEAGHTCNAEELLVRLTRLPDLSPEVAEEVHARLGRIRLDQDDYLQARRHFVAASALAPNKAEYHHLAAVALLDDPNSDTARTAKRFQKAMRLEPTNTTYRADYGIFALQCGNREEALKVFGQACDQGADVDVVGRIVDALLACDEVDEARKLVRTEMFRRSHDRSIRELWNNLQYQILCRRQIDEEPVALRKQPKKAVLLPFLRPFTPDTKAAGRRRIANVRKDEASKRMTLHLRVSDKQHA